MSYDVYVLTGDDEVCGACGRRNAIEYHTIGNMTSNVSPMWTKALTAAKAKLSGKDVPLMLGEIDPVMLYDLEGWSCSKAIPLLTAAIEHINDPANTETYAAMNPSNGWGNVDSARRFLGIILAKCNEVPEGRLHISH